MCCNFLSQPDYVKKNADLTAHIACALLTAKYQVFPMEQKRILVCGYGRIGKELCRLLRNEGATVTAAARRPEVREEILAQCDGAVDIYDLETWIQNFDVIFNTVPSPVISRRELKHVNDHALLIELASYPYWIDFEEAANQKVTAFLEAGLPGKYMPDLEAEAMLYEIMKQEKGEGIWN